MAVILSAGVYNAYSDTNSPFVYIVWSVLAISLFLEDRLGHPAVLSAGLMYFPASWIHSASC